MPLQAIMPNFSGSNASMRNAMTNVNTVGDMAHQYIADEENKRRYEAEQKYRIEKDAREQANWEKSFSLQQAADERAKAQETRMQQDQERKLLGEQRLAEYASRLTGGLTRGEMSQTSADKANLMLDEAIKSGMTPEQAGAKVFGTYGDNGQQLTKGSADKLLQFSAPKTTADKLAYIKSAGFESPDYAAGPLLEYQQKLAAPFEQQLRDEERMTNEWNMLKAKQAFDAKENEKNRAVKEEKFQPYVATVGYDSKGNITNNPAKIAYKSQISITSPKMDDYAVKKYGKDNLMIGAITDFIPDKAGSSGTGSAVVPIRTGTGSWDDRRISNLATVLQTAGLSNKDAIGLANMSAEDRWFGTGVNFNKVLDPIYTKLKAKNPSITRQETAELINTAFD